ncbi:multimeric flavodoxin WrbA [Nocardia transvalensis]|uniref:Multimeric flavodoxin WrbA n=1 Tax=Nocardia transvalensis TaxID=37333 RepID=A0A7W9PH14_9NOCA|nr:NAD(P)H-dependent oxidoreductase [Nocardia transvalensis]MBB5916046.1 multimeric flavodoxin WrbA [Nocardia transvalensis]
MTTIPDNANDAGRDTLTAVALVCTLKKSPDGSSSELLAQQLLAELAKEDVEGEIARVSDFDVHPGITADEGGGDEWPGLRSRVAGADVLVLATPIWLGHPCSVAQRVLERLNAESSETDDEGRPAMAGKVAVTAIVGNEDGAHKVTADLFQGLDDIGFSIPAQGSTYWTGEAMGSVDYRDLDQVPDAVRSTTAGVARNAAHLARLLRERPYPPGK